MIILNNDVFTPVPLVSPLSGRAHCATSTILNLIILKQFVVTVIISQHKICKYLHVTDGVPHPSGDYSFHMGAELSLF
jgi:hypothetical protein